MSAQPDQDSTAPERVEALHRPQSRARRIATRGFRFGVGVILSQFAVGAILVAGWVARRMQRAAFQQWWRMAAGPQDEERYLRVLYEIDPALATPDSPRWLRHEYPQQHRELRQQAGDRRRIRTFVFLWTASLWQNFKRGATLLFHTFVLTLPATLLWAFSWRYGWDNSFNFGYEQSAIGPTLGLSGVAVFILVMCYLPLAQARLVVSQEWRTMYALRQNLRLIRRKWAALLVLAALYFLLSLPVIALKVAIPFSIGDDPEIAALPNAEIASLLDTRYLVMGAIGLLGFVFLHLHAARIYAAGLAAALREGVIAPGQLAGRERDVLARLGLIQSADRIAEHPALRFARKTAGRGVFATGILATIIVWFGVVAQIYVGQFLVYMPLRGWLNQPMIHAPWFNYTPAYLYETDGEPPLPDAVFK